MDAFVRTDRPPVSRPLAALAGVLAAAGGLAAGQLVAGAIRSATSPVIAVGNAVVDTVPQSIKQWAIDTLGTADKPVLVAGILVVLTLLAAATGVLARRRPAAAAGAVMALGGAGILAAALPSGTVVGLAILPSLVATLVAVPLLLRLVRPVPSDRPLDDPDGPASTPRRRFLATAGWTVVAAAAGVSGGWLLSTRFDVAAERAELALPAPTTRAPPVPDAAHPDIPGLPPFITPNDRFYRIDTRLTVPRLTTDDWTLRLHGMVDQERTWGYDELLALDSIEIPITLTCVSNEVGGDLVDTAVWQGVPLELLLRDVGVDPAANQLVGRSFDGFTTGMPVAAARDRDTLVAYAMNGEPLPAEHGFPLRMVTPGLYGYVSACKWLSEIELTTFDAFDQYWVDRGWDRLAPIFTQSRIDVPEPFARVPIGETVAVAGVAWAQTRGIDRVEVQVDDGPWRDAELAAPVNDVTWRQWVWPWDTTGLTPGRHRLTVRATDEEGRTQTSDVQPPAPRGATGWHSIAVLAEDSATA